MILNMTFDNRLSVLLRKKL